MSGITRDRWPGMWRGVPGLALAAVVLSGSGGSMHQPPRQGAALAFQGVTVVDVRSGRLLPEQTVVVVGRRIRRVGPARDVRVPAGATRVEAQGKYLIPGLWDMHMHQSCYWDVTHPLLIANGVTGVREAYTWYLDSLLQLRRLIAAGRRVGPRQVAAGAALLAYGEKPLLTPDCRQPNGPPVVVQQIPLGSVATARARAQHLVDSLKAAGADFIKSRMSGHISGYATPDSVLGERKFYFAVAAAARRAHIPFEGHLPWGVVTPAEASDAGQRIIDHDAGNGICFDTAGGTWSMPDDTVSFFAACQRLAHQLRRNGTWYMQNMGVCPDQNDTSAATWDLPPDPSEIINQLRRWLGWGGQGAWVLAGRANLPLLAGTDPGNVEGQCVGAALHTALAMYQWLGLTPLQALQTATLNPALVYHATDSLGTVEPGKLADLILLDANPLEDVYNTTKIRAVVANGRYFDRAALDSLRAQAWRAKQAIWPT